ncbi:putative amidoligase enzyme-domain-containing protein [Diplogelasinospora grovesii]|uniref:Amidoligase enzyme-domain-containing protein n=1 Tax=Diplogelasinospora grovesii TaxID=303347 RepID=A0AAN6NEM7_9PEZI|nr:putative amidoligase enzyme-domain-containing protein [Diplogelasinospora grovesii]
MADQNSFQFGVEIELLLGSRKKAHANWKSLAKDLSKRLLKAGIANHVNEGNEKTQENYLEWSIVQEVTIPSQPAKNLFGLELVSPVYPIYAYWAADLATIFNALHASFTLVASPHCSTHVHISGAPAALSGPELAALAKAVLYYEPALDQLVPPGRRSSTAYWCQSNRVNPSLCSLANLADCLAVIDAAAASSGAGNVRPVVEAMNLFPAASAYGRAHGKKQDFVRGKVYKWDFTGMLPPHGRGTVEFRQAPGSLIADDATAWITLTAAFVMGAMAVGPQLSGVGGGGGASLEDLWALLTGGAQALGWDGLGAVEGLFAHSG